MIVLSRSANGLPSLCRTAGLVAALIVFLVGTGSAQNSTDDVHVVPRVHTAAPEKSVSEPFNPAGDSAVGRVKVRVDLVLVPVTVTDAMNRPVTGLKKDNFLLFEDEKPQDIRYFSAEDVPISVGILFDVSATMANKMVAARKALAEFFLNSHPDDDYFVITFADRPELIADSTRSTDDVQRSLASVIPSGHTALLDAIHLGLAKLRSAHYQRRALLIISDGGDNWSRHKLREVQKEVEESGDVVYAMGLFNDEFPVLSALNEKFSKGLLNKVTEASGGRMLSVDNLHRLSDAAGAISKEMRSEYVLGYRSTNTARNGKWRKIKVRVAAAPVSDDNARLYPAYKRGYIAPVP